MTAADWILAVSIVVLVSITGICTWLVHRVSDAARKQAEASMKMAVGIIEQSQTLKETILASLRPVLAARVVQMEKGENEFSLPREIEIEIQNTGKGIANNIVLNCDGLSGIIEYTEEHLPFLEIADTQSFHLYRISNDSDTVIKTTFLIINVMYNDELGGLWNMALRLVKENGVWNQEGSTLKRV